MDTINRLIELFTRFPGIGPRVARRFVYFLLAADSGYVNSLARLLLDLKKAVSRCSSCRRFFAVGKGQHDMLCPICANPNRTKQTLLVVEKDVDFENIERSGAYDGLYYLLGDTLPPFGKEPDEKRFARDLIDIVRRRAEAHELQEVILAFSVNADGEHTTRRLAELLAPLSQQHGIRVTIPARGFSTGTEIEYPDAETIKNALKNRA